jgi:hypothetical protein
MNWKLILQLSLFGLVMAFATAFVVPSNVEPLLWLPIFVVCAWLIARFAPRLYFLHGLLLGVVNSVWITVVHVAFFDPYLAHHAREAAMMRSTSTPIPPRLLMARVGPVIGVVSGVVIGLLAQLAAWIMRRGPRAMSRA